MRPVGVVSKNFMGQRMILWKSWSWSLEEARRVPYKRGTIKSSTVRPPKPEPPGPEERTDLNEGDSSEEFEQQHDAHGGGVDGGILLHPGIVLHADADSRAVARRYRGVL